MAAPLPANEQKRLELLHGLGILDTPPEERFDRITRFANLLLSTPISLISLVDSDRQWFKSMQGLNLRETSRDVAFCAHAIINEQTFFVEDATQDSRFKDNPLVIGAPHIRMYAGHPIELENGLRIGTMCVIDNKPRKFAASEQEILKHLAEWVKTEIHSLELEKNLKLVAAKTEVMEKKSANNEKLYDFFNSLTLIDHELRLPNTVYLNLYLTQEIARLRFSAVNIAVMVVAIDDIENYEKKQGAAAAIEAIRSISQIIADYPKWPRGMTFRLSRSRFAVVLPEKKREDAMAIAETLRDEIHKQRIAYETHKPGTLLTATFGICSVAAGSPYTDRLIVKATEAVETGQRQGRGKIKYADIE